MQKNNLEKSNRIYVTVILMFAFSYSTHAQQNVISVDWNKVEHVSKTTPTLQVVENPMLRKNSPIHDASFAALKNLGADYVRYVPWFPYAKMAVAELKAPTKTETFWDFTYLDSTMDYFMHATEGHSVIINFSTTPVWMWKTKTGVKYPDDPYEVFWDYNQGTELRDTTAKEVAGYYSRLLSWYTKGGFTDELGKFHKSNHFYKIPYWEVLNEPDFEHSLSPQLYTKIFDAVVGEMKKVSPSTKFIGLALAYNTNPEWFEFFLNLKNHRAGISVDGISYHHYSTPSWSDQKIDDYQYTFFDKANSFLDKVRYIENIRKRLSPKTFTTIDEIGSIINQMDGKNIPDGYWNLSGAMYAYVFLELTKLGIDIAGESQLVGYPTQFPDVSMMNWKNGNPNARYWTLKLIKDNFGPNDKLVATSFDSPDIICQAFITAKGKKFLLINQHNKEVQINLPAEAKNSTINFVDEDTNEKPPVTLQISGTGITLKPYAVAVVQIK
jgi:hypothetical protein